MVRARYGRIINISSVAGLMGNPGQVNYSASKAGLGGFTRALAKEVASRNITVNCIAPGFILTDMTSHFKDDELDNILKKIPANKLGDPKNIADLALFLGSLAGASAVENIGNSRFINKEELIRQIQFSIK